MFRCIVPVFCAVLLGAPDAQAAPAAPSRAVERVHVFATCAGRLAALATRQRAFNQPDADENQRLMETFELLVEATLPDALADGVAERQTERWRVGGWSEMAFLLADVDYSFDQRRVDRARIVLQSHIATCRALVL